MSKYIKQDDVFELVRKGVLISNGNFESVCKHIGSLPTIEVGGLIDRRCFIGKWKDHYYPHFEVAGIECSVCGKDVPYWSRHNKLPNYCPNCGARMEVEE